MYFSLFKPVKQKSLNPAGVVVLCPYCQFHISSDLHCSHHEERVGPGCHTPLKEAILLINYLKRKTSYCRWDHFSFPVPTGWTIVEKRDWNLVWGSVSVFVLFIYDLVPSKWSKGGLRRKRNKNWSLIDMIKHNLNIFCFDSVFTIRCL